MLVEGKRRNIAKAILSKHIAENHSIFCYFFFTNCFASFLLFIMGCFFFTDFKCKKKSNLFYCGFRIFYLLILGIVYYK